jgi:hypothetical protein
MNKMWKYGELGKSPYLHILLLGMAGAHLTGGLQQYHMFVYNCAMCLLNHFLFLARRHNETIIC